MKNKIISLLIVILVPFLLLLPFFIVDLQPDGEISTTITANKVSPFIKSPLPQDRVEIDDFLTITGDPVYLNVFPPRSGYNTVEFTFTYNPRNVQLFEFGPQMNIFTESFDLRPMYSRLLEEISGQGDWRTLTSNDGTIFTTSNADNYYEARDGLARGNLLTYRYDIDSLPFRISDYEPSFDRMEYEVDLRGSHTFLTYIKNETLYLELELTDMNRVLGEDNVNIRVFNENGTEVAHEKLDEDGNDSMNQIVTPRTLKLSVPGLEEGVYEISLETTTDIFTRRITTTQSKFVFKNKLYMADSVGWRENPTLTSVYTDANQFSVQTLHSEGLQTLTIGDAEVAVDEIKERKNIEIKGGGVKKLSAPRANLEIVSNGVFSITADSYFSPLIPNINAWTDISEITYPNIISSYKPPVSNSGFYTSTVTFDLATIPKTPTGAMRFIVSLPNLEDGAELEIKEIKATFRRDPVNSLNDLISFIKSRL